MNRHLQALQRINNAANSVLDLAETLGTTARTVAEEMQADLCSIFIFDEASRRLELRATNGPRPSSGPHFTLALGQGYSGAVAQNGHPLTLFDASTETRYAEECGAYVTKYRGLLSMPIIFFTVEKLVGVINVQTESAHEFTADDVSFLEIVAGQLAMNIGNGRLYEQTDETLRRKVHELSTIQSVSSLVVSSLELKTVLELIVMKAVQLSETDRSIIFQLDHTSARLLPVAQYGFEDAHLDHGLPLGQCCAGRAVSSGEPCRSLDCMHADEGCFFRDRAEASDHLHAVLCVPLVSTHGMQGALCVYSAQRYHLSTHQLQLVVTFANVAAIAMDNARLFEQAREGLRTNSMLVHEMHHRVRNNLQQVGSILNMQRRRVNSPEAERVLMESYERIIGIAETHDLLSRDRFGVAAVDVIARKIVGVVRAHLVPPELRLRIEVEPCPVLLPSEAATTLAIIINELIANAIEHGFAGRTRGLIRISGHELDGMITVRVADNGGSLPANFDASASDSMGLTVIRSLVDLPLRGTFSLHREPSASAQAPADEVAEGSAEEVSAGWTVAEIAFPTPALDGADQQPSELMAGR